MLAGNSSITRSSTFAFGDSNKPKTSHDAVSLGVDKLPFSVRKFPGSLANTSFKKSFGEKVKDFFLNSNMQATDTKVDSSVSCVEDLLKKYNIDESIPGAVGTVAEDDLISVAVSNSTTQAGDNISFASVSSLSNATDLSADPCYAFQNQFEVQIKSERQMKASVDSSAASFQRSASGCETCQSLDSGFSDYRKKLDASSKIESTNGLVNFFSKGIFSRLKGNDAGKSSPPTNINNYRKTDELMTKITQAWVNDILPHWDRGSRRWRHAHELWWLGLPPKIRGRVWKLAIGNDLHISEDLYKICLDRAACVFQHISNEKTPLSTATTENPLFKLSKIATPGLCIPGNESVGKPGSLPAADKPLLQSLPSILLDLSRTFPQLGLFQDGGPMHGALKNLLSAYTSYRPDIGYVQGMSFIASLLLLNMDEFDAFVAFTNLINRPLHLAMFSVDKRRITAYVATFKKMLWSLMPELAGHFAAHRLSPDVYLFEWLLPVFCRSFSIDVVSRIWDVYFRDGENFLFKVALAILKQNEASLLASDFDQMIAILHNVRAQAELTNGEQLFLSIRAISKTRIASSESFTKLLNESIALDADGWCENGEG